MPSQSLQTFSLKCILLCWQDEALQYFANALVLTTKPNFLDSISEGRAVSPYQQIFMSYITVVTGIAEDSDDCALPVWCNTYTKLHYVKFTEYSILLLNTINIGLAQHTPCPVSCVDHKPHDGLFKNSPKIAVQTFSCVFIAFHQLKYPFV